MTKIEGTLNITNEVIRYLITQPVPKVEKEEESEGKDSSDDKKATEKADDKAEAEESKED